MTIYEVGEADGEVFIAMELLHGQVLRELLAAEEVTLEQKLRWLLQAARALHAPHLRGLVHRDVKPENMFVCADGTLKLLDFGIAKRDTDTGDDSGENAYATGPSSLRTEAGRRFGTPRYNGARAARRPDHRRADRRVRVGPRGVRAALGIARRRRARDGHRGRGRGAARSVGGNAHRRAPREGTGTPRQHRAHHCRRHGAEAGRPLSFDDADHRSARARAVGGARRDAAAGHATRAGHALGDRDVSAAASADAARGAPGYGEVARGRRYPGRRRAGAPRRRASCALHDEHAPQQAHDLAPACKVSSTRVITRPPAEKVRVLSDGTLVFVHDPARGVAADLDTPRGPKPMLAFPLGWELPDKLQSWKFEAVDYQGRPTLFIAAGFGHEDGVALNGSMMLLGETMMWGARHVTAPVSGFGGTPFGKRFVMVATTLSLDSESDIHGATLYVLGVESMPVDVEPVNAKSPSITATRSRLLVSFVTFTEEVHAAVYDENLHRVGDILPLSGMTGGQPIGAFAKDSVLVYNVIDQERKSRLVVSSFHVGQEGFAKPVVAIDDAIAGVAQSFALADDSYLLAWTAARSGQMVLRVSPIGEDGLLTGTTDIATAIDIRDVALSRNASGMTIAWNDGKGQTTIADVTCQVPAVRTPAR